MDPLGFILTALLIFTFIGGPLLSYLVARRRKKTAYDPNLKTLERARRQLESVAVIPSGDRSDRQRENGDVEIGAAEPDECAICIGPLVPAPAVGHGDDRIPSMFGILPAISNRTDMVAQSANIKRGQSSNGIELNNVSITTTNGPVVAPAPASTPEDIEDNAIMRLKSCGHSFHARCLVSWFVIERYDCPICRTPYYKPLVAKTREWDNQRLPLPRTEGAQSSV